jgi:biopolymer transport protein ExbD
MMAFGGFQGQSEQQPMAEINTTPLVDVMLVLLIIFIITAPLLTHAIRIDLPQARSQSSPEKPETVTVSIDARGQVFWQGEAIAADALPARLAEAGKRQPQPELHLRADRDTRYQVLADRPISENYEGIDALLVASPLIGALDAACGVPTTMTGLHVLNGYMINNVSLQLIRPAEFIELTFTQRMQGV